MLYYATSAGPLGLLDQLSGQNLHAWQFSNGLEQMERVLSSIVPFVQESSNTPVSIVLLASLPANWSASATFSLSRLLRTTFSSASAPGLAYLTSTGSFCSLRWSLQRKVYARWLKLPSIRRLFSTSLTRLEWLTTAFLSASHTHTILYTTCSLLVGLIISHRSQYENNSVQTLYTVHRNYGRPCEGQFPLKPSSHRMSGGVDFNLPSTLDISSP